LGIVIVTSLNTHRQPQPISFPQSTSKSDIKFFRRRQKLHNESLYCPYH